MDFTLVLIVAAVGLIIIINYVIGSKNKKEFDLKDNNSSKVLDEVVLPRVEPVSHPAFDIPDHNLNIRKKSTDKPKLFKNVEQIIVLNVHAAEGFGFLGPALFQSLLESWLRLGELGLFHRYDKNGAIMFSVANAVNSTSLDVVADNFVTPCVSFFMLLPGAANLEQTFKLMLDAARKLAYDLDGEVKDENFNSLTKQTVEHYLATIAEFDRIAALKNK